MKIQEIYDQYNAKVKRFIKAMVKDDWAVDDLLQETFYKAGKNIGSLAEPDKVSSWLYKIAYNVCIDHFRLQKKETTHQQTILKKKKPGKEISILQKMEQQEMSLCVQKMIDLLPEQLRSVLVFYDVLEFRHREISEILSISVENSKVRLHRARKKMKSILKENCTFEKDDRNVLVCEPVIDKTDN